MHHYDCNLSSLINSLESFIKNPEIGLPDEVFYFIGRVTPYLNVDVLVKIPDLGYVLTWRDDVHTGAGWHVPGGIVRLRESMEQRVNKVANLELKVNLAKIIGPIEINEIISKQKERSHFISTLFYAEIDDKNIKKILMQINENPQKINLFKEPPENLLRWHEIYKSRIKI